MDFPPDIPLQVGGRAALLQHQGWLCMHDKNHEKSSLRKRLQQVRCKRKQVGTPRSLSSLFNERWMWMVPALDHPQNRTNMGSRNWWYPLVSLSSLSLLLSSLTLLGKAQLPCSTPFSEPKFAVGVESLWLVSQQPGQVCCGSWELSRWSVKT